MKPDKATQKSKFPDPLYARIEDEGTEDEYLYADKDFDGVEDGVRIAVYELKEIKTVRSVLV